MVFILLIYWLSYFNENNNNSNADNGFSIEQSVGMKMRFIRLPNDEIYANKILE